MIVSVKPEGPVPLLILLEAETESALLSVPHITPLSVTAVAFVSLPPETAQVEPILMDGLVTTIGWIDEPESLFFLQPVENTARRITHKISKT